jgi:serine/threonine protein phosphatase PrpC
MLTFAAHTDIGKRRKLNEDAIYAADGLFIVCDGMGGHKAGEIAAQLAVDAIVGFIRRSQADPELTWPYGFDIGMSLDGNRLGTAIKLANRAVLRAAASTDEYTGMGTTVAAVLIPPGKPRMVLGHVGDSRIYLIRTGAIDQLTRDDSFANVDWGEAVDEPNPAVKNILTKALGARDDVEVEIADRPLESGDILLVCSDGLTNMVPDRRLLEIIEAGGGDVDRACRALVDEANAGGGKDNISAIVVRFQRS